MIEALQLLALTAASFAAIAIVLVRADLALDRWFHGRAHRELQRSARDLARPGRWW